MVKNNFYWIITVVSGVCIGKGCYLIHPGLIWLFVGFALMFIGLIHGVIKALEDQEE